MKKKIKSKPNRPRLRVFRSNKHIYAQVIDDNKNFTIVTSSSLCPQLRINSNATCKIAKLVGEDIGKKLKNKGITRIIFDRGNRKYHGKIQALADATRKEGINF